MDRQQTIGLLLQPLLSLLVLAVRTVPIAARTTHPVLTLTAIAGEDHMPQLTRATTRDGAEHFALLECDFVSALLQKQFAMLPQTVGDCGHDWLRILTNPATSPAPRRRLHRADCSVADDETVR